jgi:glycosyltransferase involved in cell wall biosynthesis
MGDALHLLVLLPALNEEKTLGSVIDRIPRDIEGIATISVLVVDDGSTDATAQIARDRGATVVSHRFNRGVGAAFRTGIQAALRTDADIIVNMDADGQFDPADIPKLTGPIVAGEADMVTCTRFGKKEYIPEMPAIKRWGNRMMCRLINRICWNAAYTDVSCGFRAYSRETAMRLTLFGDFTYTQESFIDLLAKGVHIVEVPLKVRGVREFGKSRVARSLWRYAILSGGIIFRAARDIRPLAFFGSVGAVLVLLGVICGLIVFSWWAATGHTYPIKNVLIGSAVFLLMGFLLFVLALIADMLGRQRTLLEKILLNQRRNDRSAKKPPRADRRPDNSTDEEA